MHEGEASADMTGAQRCKSQRNAAFSALVDHYQIGRGGFHLPPSYRQSGMNESRPQQGRPLHRQAGRHRAWK
jgi:hypothetical protein